MPYFWCTQAIGPPVRRKGKKGRVRTRPHTCNEKMTWRESFPWSRKINHLRPDQIVDLMYHWSMQHSVEETSHESGIHRATVGDVYDQFRETVSEFTANATKGEKLGGPGRIVCIDETHITRKSNNRGGFQGRTTLGHQTIVMAGVELNGKWAGRKETGKSFCVIVEDHSALTFRQVIEAHVHPGSIIWTDGHASYLWLDGDERFVHESVIHRRGEFARLRADGVVISTNAIEGLFSRVKRMLKAHHAIPRRSSGYGQHLGEFLWRSRFVHRKKADWRRRAFFELLRAIRATQPRQTIGWDVPMEFDPWYAETFEWFKAEYSAPRVRCGRGVRKHRLDARPRRNPRESEGIDAAIEPDVMPLGDDLEAELEEVMSEASRKRPPSPLPLADAIAADGMLAGTGRTRRVRRRRDLPSAYIEVFPRRNEPATAEERASEASFTPTPVTDGTRCLARTWNGGCGGQCNLPPDSSSEIGVCKRHQRDDQRSHGLVTGPIPPQKLDAFRRASANRNVRASSTAETVPTAADAAEASAEVNHPDASSIEAPAAEPAASSQLSCPPTPGRTNERDEVPEGPVAIGYVLQDPIPGVPIEVHLRMESLLQAGVIPKTTHAQRLRCGTRIATRGTEYFVPNQLIEARDYGYVSPNFAEASNMRWVREPGAFRLITTVHGG